VIELDLKRCPQRAGRNATKSRDLVKRWLYCEYVGLKNLDASSICLLIEPIIEKIDRLPEERGLRTCGLDNAMLPMDVPVLVVWLLLPLVLVLLAE
jgi:hypothetical protein